ncbi:MAG: hydrogenase iron-sulfur subunit [Theionarchaea archaeon]|nr:hydrogenase iron-sulfur subunit [Theionarchaea archaeon]
MYEPKIIGFLCNWCSYAAADLAGTSRIQYPPNLRSIRVMCSGRVDPEFILRAFMNGADGVLVAGCHPGDCHYITGNLEAEKKIKMTKMLLQEADFDPERLRLEWCSSAEGGKFAQVVGDFVNQLKALGPPSFDEKKLKAAFDTSLKERLRSWVGKERKLTEEGNVYGDLIEQNEFNRLMEEVIKKDYEESMILLSIEDSPLSAKQIAEHVGLDPSDVVQHLIKLKKRQVVYMVEGDPILYRRART